MYAIVMLSKLQNQSMQTKQGGISNEHFNRIFRLILPQDSFLYYTWLQIGLE